MIRAAKIYLTLFMLAIFLPGISVANEKYPLLAESGAEAKPVETMQVAENIFIPGEEIIVAGDEQAELTGAEPAVIVDSDPPVTTESGPEVTAEPGEQDEIEPPAIIKPAALIAVIIDDLGNQRTAGERTVALEGPVAVGDALKRSIRSADLVARGYAKGVTMGGARSWLKIGPQLFQPSELADMNFIFVGQVFGWKRMVFASPP